MLMIHLAEAVIYTVALEPPSEEAVKAAVPLPEGEEDF